MNIRSGGGITGVASGYQEWQLDIRSGDWMSRVTARYNYSLPNYSTIYIQYRTHYSPIKSTQ